MSQIDLEIKNNTNLKKIKQVFFRRSTQTDLKFLWKCKGPRITMQNSNKARHLEFLDFKTYGKATLMKIMWY